MPRPRLYEFCTVEECGKPHFAKSYCRTHYKKFVVTYAGDRRNQLERLREKHKNLVAERDAIAARLAEVEGEVVVLRNALGTMRGFRNHHRRCEYEFTDFCTCGVREAADKARQALTSPATSEVWAEHQRAVGVVRRVRERIETAEKHAKFHMEREVTARMLKMQQPERPDGVLHSEWWLREANNLRSLLTEPEGEG